MYDTIYHICVGHLHRSSRIRVSAPLPLSPFYTDPQNSTRESKLLRWSLLDIPPFICCLPLQFFLHFFPPPEVPSPPISQYKHYLLVCPFYRPINWSLKLINYSHLWAQIHRCQAVKPLLLDALSFKVLFLLFKKAQDIEPSSINNETYLCLLYAR